MNAPTPQTVALIDLAQERAELGAELEQALLAVLRGGRYVLGPEVQAFEREFAAWSGTRHAVGVASGTDALELSLQALGVGPGDEVLTTPFSFFATASSIARLGARPRFADIEADTGLLDPELASQEVGPRTRAIVPVHLFGQLTDMRALRALADKHGLALLEDAAQAHGASREGVRAGALGDMAAFSFYPTKNLGAAGDGGAILSNDEALHALVLRLRDHGSAGKYEHIEVGTNSRLDELQAAVLRVKLPHLAEWNERRRRVAARYDAALSGSAAVRPLLNHAGSGHVWHQYAVRLADPECRGHVLAGLADRGIQAAVHYPRPIHLQPAAREWGWGPGDLPRAEALAKCVLCLPIHPFLSLAEVDRVAECLLTLAG